MADKLSDDAVEAGIAGTDWRRDGDAIARDLEFGDFKAEIAMRIESALTLGHLESIPVIRDAAQKAIDLRHGADEE